MMEAEIITCQPHQPHKDWVGDTNSVFKTLGASNHAKEERQTHDYYATDPRAASMLLEIEHIPMNKPIWECAAGERHLADKFVEHGYEVRCTDLIRRCEDVEILDFLSVDNALPFDGTIITNPPYSVAQQFVEKALSIVTEGNKVCMFLKTLFLEGQARRQLFQSYPPKTVWVSSSRILCAKNGQFDNSATKHGGALAYSWFVWQKGWGGVTELKWFN